MKLHNRNNNGFKGSKLRRNSLLIGGALVLLFAILFGSQIDNLLNLFGSRADEITEAPDWSIVQNANMDSNKALGELVDIEIGSQRYLYSLGGMNDGALLDTVERLEIDPALGTPVDDADWETSASWGKMYSPRAAFKAFQYKDEVNNSYNYLYVVSGDVHIPYNDEIYTNPLLFSTVERLDLTDPTANWNPVTVLAGVNFYPEILVRENELNIVGGIYGYPKDVYSQIDFDGDQTRWDERYNNLSVIGPNIGDNDNPQEMLGLPDGGDGNNIGLGGAGTDGGVGENPVFGAGGSTVFDDGLVHIAQIADDENFAKMLSDTSISGDFVTSVSEHYVIDLNNNSEIHIGEMGISGGINNDFRGNLYEDWQIGAVSKIGHLRVVIQQKKTGVVGNPTIEYLIDPAPQGRYGHKVFVHKESPTDTEYMYIVGGASWSGVFEKVEIVNIVAGTFEVYINQLNTFWVIDDVPHMITWEVDGDPLVHRNPPLPNFKADGLFEGLEYQYMGNTVYRVNFSTRKWEGTNTQTNSPYLDPKYNIGPGRAFFGLSFVHPKENVTEWVITGGLQNNFDDSLDEDWIIDDPDSPPFYVTMPGLRYQNRLDCNVSSFEHPKCGNWGLSVRVSDQVDKLDGDDPGSSFVGWYEQIALPYQVFNHGSVGLSEQTYVFGGATEFGNPDTPFFNYHMPTNATNPSPLTYLQKLDETWLPAYDVKINELHSAMLGVRTPISIIGGVSKGERVVAYKAGGENDNRIEYIGPVEYGAEGIWDITQSYMGISPFTKPISSEWDLIDLPNDEVNGTVPVPTVLADRYDYATVTITLKDYYGNDISSDDASNILVTLYTDRSSRPAVDKNVWDDGNTTKDWIRMAGETGTNPLSDINYNDQFAIVDGGGEGGGEDGNINTSVGQVQFRIGSAFNTYSSETNSDPIELYIYAVTTGGSILFDGALGGGMNSLSLTSHGVPSYESRVVATTPVKPNGADVSEITAVLLDMYGDPIQYKPIIIESSRNTDDDIWDIITTVNDITDSFGKAFFTMSSTHLGHTEAVGYVNNSFPYPTNSVGETRVLDDQEQYIQQQKLGVRTAPIYFDTQGRIITLLPDVGRQGQTIQPITATGEDTQWAQGETTVDFIRPDLGFFWCNNDPTEECKGNEDYDFDSFVFNNDDYSPREMGIVIMPNELAILEITQGDGSFYPYSASEYPKTILSNVPADEDGHIYFEYQAAIGETGVVKIKVTTHTSGKVDVPMWFPVVESNPQVPKDMVITAVPDTVDFGANIESLITAKVWINGAETTLPVSFEKDESDTDGILKDSTSNTIMYERKSNEPGVVRVFATANYDGMEISGRVAITKTVQSDSDPDAFISYTPSDLVIDPPDGLHLYIGGSGVYIPVGTAVGQWIFQVTTVDSFDAKHIETHPFYVLEGAFNSGARLIKIDPTEGYVGSNDNIIEITGADTTFLPPHIAPSSPSVVTFTPVYPNPNKRNENLSATIINDTSFNDSTHLKVRLDIPDNITPGYWNVTVTTGTEVADKLGDRDYFITTATDNYMLRLDADSDTLTRNGTDISDLTAEVIYIDPNPDPNNPLPPQPNIPVTFSLVSSNGGELETPMTTNTDANGEAFNSYTTDAGDLDATARIKASADLSSEGVTSDVADYADIVRLAWTGTENPDETETTISAISPVLIDPDGDGLPYSTVVVTVRNSLGRPLIDKTVTLASDRGVDVISPSVTQTTNQDGRVTYQVSAPTIGTSTITASIESVGVITYIRFVAASSEVVLRSFNIIAPFQNRDYDNWTVTAIKDNSWSENGDTDYVAYYRKNARDDATDPDLISEISNVQFYLHNSHTYTVWVKGKNHLAVSNTAVAPGNVTDIDVDFGSANNNKGLLIGDIITKTGNTAIPGGFHDNIIGTIGLIASDDLGLVVEKWFEIFDLADLFYDGVVNAGDVLVCLNNLGNGATKP